MYVISVWVQMRILQLVKFIIFGEFLNQNYQINIKILALG